jgi:hypothetical protein
MLKRQKPQPSQAASDWKSQIATAYLKVPKSLREMVWRISVAGVTIVSSLAGLYVYRNPGIVFGTPVAQQSIIQRLSGNKDLRQTLYELMENFYYRHDPRGLMLVSWEEVDSLVGIWVRPADEFPGKSGPHGLTPDMRVLAGPFVFGECMTTESMAMQGMVMVACPINSSYDAWGYVAAVVPESEVKDTLVLVRFLAHRVTRLVY